MGSKNKLKRERIRFKKKCFRKKEEGKPWINEYQIPVRRPLAGDPAGPSASSMRLPTERRCRRLHSPPPRRGLVAARLPQASALLSATSGLKRRHGPAPTRPGGGARPSLSSCPNKALCSLQLRYQLLFNTFYQIQIICTFLGKKPMSQCETSQNPSL